MFLGLPKVDLVCLFGWSPEAGCVLKGRRSRGRGGGKKKKKKKKKKKNGVFTKGKASEPCCERITAPIKPVRPQHQQRCPCILLHSQVSSNNRNETTGFAFALSILALLRLVSAAAATSDDNAPFPSCSLRATVLQCGRPQWSMTRKSTSLSACWTSLELRSR